MKLISSLIFFVIIGITQFLSLVDKDMDLENHVQIQQELSGLIANYVKENLPNMTDFRMLSVYTKSPKKGKVEAYFNYSFKTPTANTNQNATTELSGFATLKRIKELPEQQWALDKIEVQGEDVTFNDPIVITPSKDTAKDIEEKSKK